MRVLQVNKFLYRRGGAEAHMLDVAELLRRAGHEVEFYGMQHPDNPTMTYERHFPTPVELEPMPRSPRARAQAIARMMWSTSARAGIARVMDDFRPDVVHLHNIYHHLSPSILSPIRARGIGTVMTLHDYKLACPSYLFMRDGVVCEACLGGHFRRAVQLRCKDHSLVKSSVLAAELRLHTSLKAYDPVQVFICPSRFMRDKMTAAGVFPERLEILHHFVPGAGAVSDLPPKQIVAYLGRLSAEKGPDVLVEAAASLPPGATVEIAGDGPMLSQLKHRADELAPGVVSFLGRVDSAGVSQLLARASVVAVPSRCYENQPLAALEAFSHGKPVVGTRLGGIEEMVVEGVTGILVPPDDPPALAAAITSVLRDAHGAQRMGAAARALAASEYSETAYTDGIERIYRQVTANAREVLER